MITEKQLREISERLDKKFPSPPTYNLAWLRQANYTPVYIKGELVGIALPDSAVGIVIPLDKLSVPALIYVYIKELFT